MKSTEALLDTMRGKEPTTHLVFAEPLYGHSRRRGSSAVLDSCRTNPRPSSNDRSIAMSGRTRRISSWMCSSYARSVRSLKSAYFRYTGSSMSSATGSGRPNMSPKRSVQLAQWQMPWYVPA